MIDRTKLADDWGYTMLGASPTTTATTGKTSITKAPTATVQPTATQGVSTSGTWGTGGTMANFQYPSEWDQLGDVWSQMASGNYTNSGMDWLKNMMGSGGNAFDVSGWDKSYRPQMMDDYSNMVKQMAEQAGVSGTRYGSGLQNSIANYGGQLQNKYTSDLWDRMFGAYESGQNRAAGAGNLLSQLGLSSAQTGAEGLLSLGQNKARLPMSVASLMSGIGQGMTSQQVDPWTQLMASLLGPTSQATPQTYTPNALQSILASLSQTLPASLQAWDNQGWWKD